MRAGILAAAFALATLVCSRADAGPAVLFDPADGKILYAEDMDAIWHPASLTKIMTAYLTFEALKQGRLTLDQRIPYSELAAEQPPSKLGLPLNAQLTVESALKALIIKSANDVAVMLAEAIGGSQPGFVAMMNNTAQRLGMTRTNFINPNGLPALQQVTTARDLAKLARAVTKDYPEYAAYWSMEEARIANIRLATHNGLLHSFEGADGMKTGFICDSGYNVIGTATRNGRQLAAVVLGEQSGAARTVRAASLLEHGFHEYDWKALFSPQTIDDAPMTSDSIGVTSVRDTIYSAECGNSRRAVAKARKKRGKTATAATETAPAGQTAPGATTTSQEPAVANAKDTAPAAKAPKAQPVPTTASAAGGASGGAAAAGTQPTAKPSKAKPAAAGDVPEKPKQKPVATGQTPKTVSP